MPPSIPYKVLPAHVWKTLRKATGKDSVVKALMYVLKQGNTLTGGDIDTYYVHENEALKPFADGLYALVDGMAIRINGDPADYPTNWPKRGAVAHELLPVIGYTGRAFPLPPTIFAETAPVAYDEDDLRPKLSGVWLNAGRKTVTAFGCDGHLLNRRVLPNHTGVLGEILIPRKAAVLWQLIGAIQHTDQLYHQSRGRTPYAVMFSAEPGYSDRVYFRPLDEKPLPYEDAIPTENKYSRIIDIAALTRQLAAQPKLEKGEDRFVVFAKGLCLTYKLTPNNKSGDSTDRQATKSHLLDVPLTHQQVLPVVGNMNLIMPVFLEYVVNPGDIGFGIDVLKKSLKTFSAPFARLVYSSHDKAAILIPLTHEEAHKLQHAPLSPKPVSNIEIRTKSLLLLQRQRLLLAA